MAVNRDRKTDTKIKLRAERKQRSRHHEQKGKQMENTQDGRRKDSVESHTHEQKRLNGRRRGKLWRT